MDQRIKFDFTNGGGIPGHDFRLDIDGDTIAVFSSIWQTRKSR